MPYVQDLITPDIPVDQLPPDPDALEMTDICIIRRCVLLPENEGDEPQIFKRSMETWSLPLEASDAKHFITFIKPNEGRFAIFIQFHDFKFLIDYTENSFQEWKEMVPDYQPESDFENMRHIWVVQEDLYMPTLGEVEVPGTVFPIMEMTEIRRWVPPKPPPKEEEDKGKGKTDGGSDDEGDDNDDDDDDENPKGPHEKFNQPDMTLDQAYDDAFGHGFLRKLVQHDGTDFSSDKFVSPRRAFGELEKPLFDDVAEDDDTEDEEPVSPPPSYDVSGSLGKLTAADIEYLRRMKINNEDLSMS